MKSRETSGSKNGLEELKRTLKDVSSLSTSADRDRCTESARSATKPSSATLNVQDSLPSTDCHARSSGKASLRGEITQKSTSLKAAPGATYLVTKTTA